MPGLYALRPFPSAASRSTHKTAPKQDQHYQAGHKPASRRPVAQLSRPKRPPAASAQPIRPKTAGDLLAEPVQARIYGPAIDAQAVYVSSGSDHDPSSACLAALVHEFLEEEEEEEAGAAEEAAGACGRSRCNYISGSCSGEQSSKKEEDEDGISHSSIGEEFPEILEGILSCMDSREVQLLADVAKAIEMLREKPHESVFCLQRGVMSELRRLGYDAGICKSRWDHTGGLPAGNHEYIDVIMEPINDGKGDRLILDLDYKPNFEIARPTNIYMSYVNVLPPIFLGRPDKLQQVLKIMSEAVKSSLRTRGLHIPPWRKLSYMQAKWFSSYKRTTNEEPRIITLQTDVISSIALKGSQLCPTFTNQVEAFLCNIKTASKGTETRRGRMVSGIAGALKTCSSEFVHVEELEEKQVPAFVCNA